MDTQTQEQPQAVQSIPARFGATPTDPVIVAAVWLALSGNRAFTAQTGNRDWLSEPGCRGWLAGGQN